MERDTFLKRRRPIIRETVDMEEITAKEAERRAEAAAQQFITEMSRVNAKVGDGEPVDVANVVPTPLLTGLFVRLLARRYSIVRDRR